MDVASSDYYAVLGVARGADERDVKRAYFRLVRKYNPESQPEEFKRIRQAYEVLANSISRKDYDGLTQWGDEIGARMKAGSAAMERADFRTAQAEFKHVLVLQPKLSFARDLLGMAYLNASQPREALTQFDLLVAEQPNNSVYHLHKGYAHYALQQYAQSTVAYQRALEIDPQDTRVRIALADCYTDTEQFEAALAELDKAINADGEVNYQDFVFLMRKVQIQLLRNRPDLAEAELDQIFQVLPPDGESRKYVATKISALATQLFRMRRSADANRLLARARQLDQRKSLELQFPAKASFPVRELPPASQTILAGMKKSWTPSKLTHRTLVGPTLILCSAILTGLIALWATLGSDTLWMEEGKFFMFLFIVGTPLLAALAVRRIRRVTTSPYGKFTEVHPLYLLQVDIDKMTAWPLVNLHDVALTHHLQNGSYQATTVRMDFGGVPLSLSIRGQQAAVDWAQHLLDTRHRTLALLSDGLLDSEEGLDLIPAPLLAGQVKMKPARTAGRTLATFAGSLAGGLALFFGAALPINHLNAESDAWERAVGYGASLAGYHNYLETYPKGKHAEAAHDAIAGYYDAAKRSFEGGPHGAELAPLFDALREHDSQEIRLGFAGRDGASAPEAESEFGAGFKRAFGSGSSNSFINFTEDASTPVAGGFQLRYALREVAPKKVTKNSPWTSAQIYVDFELAVVVGGVDKYRFTGTELETCDELDQECRQRVIPMAFTAFGRKASADLGMPWTRGRVDLFGNPL